MAPNGGSSSCYLRSKGPTIGDPFPNLRGETQDTTDFNLYEYIGDAWAIVFMHPADFTPVCTTELGAAQSLMEEFELRNVKICGFSCDDASKHREWIYDIEVATGNRITFPMFCDPARTHAIELGVLDPKLKDPKDGMPLTVRSVYILNPNKDIAMTMTYPASVGRNFDEILRSVDALQRASKFGVATPANWQPGDKTIVSHDKDDNAARKMFGKDGFTTVKLPSEAGKSLSTHYLRFTDDPILRDKSRSKQSLKLASRIGKTVSWKPPVSFPKQPGRRFSDGMGIRKSLTESEDEEAHDKRSWTFFTRSIVGLKEETSNDMCQRKEHSKSVSHERTSGLLLGFRHDENVKKGDDRLSFSREKNRVRRTSSMEMERGQNQSEINDSAQMDDQKEKYLDESIVW